jgi:hypothetical protein
MSLVILVMGALVRPALAYDGGGATPQEVVEMLKQAAQKEDLAGVAACLSPEDRAGMSFGLLLGASMMVAMGGLAAEMGEGFAEAFEGGMTEGEEGDMTEGEESDGSEGEASAEDSSEANTEIAAMRTKTEEMGARLEAILTKYGVTDMMEETPSPGANKNQDPEKAMAAALADVDQIGLISELGALMKELAEGKSEGGSGVPEGDLENLQIEGDHGSATLGGEPIEFIQIDGRWFLHQPEGGGAESAESSQ